MHRSGTSLAGQMLQALGFHIGPEDQVVSPKKDNPLGYWERRDVTRLNDKVFAAQGVTWERVGTWGQEKLSASFLGEFDARAREIIAAYPAGSPWFIKDPRMCITLPLWEKHLENPVYLFVYRDPVEISRSLWNRNQHPPKLVMALWERYLSDALNATKGKRRLLLRYADLVEDPKAAVFNFVAGLRQLGVEPPCTPESALEKIEVDRTLRHHQRDFLRLEIPFTKSQETLNARVRDGSAFEWAGVFDVSEANRRIMLSQETIEAGITRGSGVTSAGTETFARLSEESTEAVSERAGRMLKSGRDVFTERGLQALEALESIHLLKIHLKRVHPGIDLGSDYAVATLSNWCTQVLHWNPLQSSFRKTRRRLLDYSTRPPETLLQSIRRSEFAHGVEWAEKFVDAGSATECLLGDLVLGRLPLLPKVTGTTGEGGEAELALELESYRASLQESARRVREALGPIAAMAPHLEPSRGEAPEPFNADSAVISKNRDAAARLLDWGLQLCQRVPLSATRGKAVREFTGYQKAEGSPELWDRERLRGMAPALKAGKECLTALLDELEQAIRAAEKIGAALSMGCA